MKIISWNCNRQFRTKFSEISKEKADIYVIQECEDPSKTKNEEYKEFAGNNYIWTGDLENQGLGIFAKEDVKIEKISGLMKIIKTSLHCVLMIPLTCLVYGPCQNM